MNMTQFPLYVWITLDFVFMSFWPTFEEMLRLLSTIGLFTPHMDTCNSYIVRIYSIANPIISVENKYL